MSLSACGHGWGLSYSTAEGSCVHNIAVVMESYRQDHGMLPKSWEQVTSYYGKNVNGQTLDDYYRGIMPSLRYAFIESGKVKTPDVTSSLMMVPEIWSHPIWTSRR
jgi:hypothetical protein